MSTPYKYYVFDYFGTTVIAGGSSLIDARAEAAANLRYDLPASEAEFIHDAALKVAGPDTLGFNSRQEAEAAVERGFSFLGDNNEHTVSKTVRPSDVSRPGTFTKQADKVSKRIKADAEVNAAEDAKTSRLPDTEAEIDHNQGELPDDKAEIDTQRRPDPEVHAPKPASTVADVIARAQQFTQDPSVRDMLADGVEMLDGQDVRTLAIAGPDTFGLAGQKSEALMAEIHQMLVDRIGDHPTRIVTNLDRGFDMLVTEAALNLRDAGMPIRVDVVAPYKGRPSLWGDPREFYDLVGRANSVSYELTDKGGKQPSQSKITGAVVNSRAEMLMDADEVITFGKKGLGADVTSMAEAMGIRVTNAYDRLAAAGIENVALQNTLFTPPNAPDRAPMVAPPATSSASMGAPRTDKRVMPGAKPEQPAGSAGSLVGGSVGKSVGNTGAKGPGNAGTPAPAATPTGKTVQPVPISASAVVPPPPPIRPPDTASTASGGPDPAVSAHPLNSPEAKARRQEFMQRVEKLLDKNNDDLDAVRTLADEATTLKLRGGVVGKMMRYLEERPNNVSAWALLGMADDDPAHASRAIGEAVRLATKRGDTQLVPTLQKLMPAAAAPPTTSPPVRTASSVLDRVTDQPTAPLPDAPPLVDSTRGGPTPLPAVVDTTVSAPPPTPVAPEAVPGDRAVPVAPDHFQRRAPRPTIDDTPVSNFFPESNGADRLSRTVLGAMPGNRLFTGVLGQAMLGTSLSQLFTNESRGQDAQARADRAASAVAETLTGIVGADPRTGGMMLASQISAQGKYEASRTIAEVAIGATAGAALSMGAEAMARGRGAGAAQMAGLAGGALGWAAGAIVAPVVVRAMDRLKNAGESQYTDTDMGLLENAVMASDSAQRLSDLAAQQFEMEFADDEGNEMDMSDDSDMPTSVDEFYDEGGDELGYEVS